uniref:Uncharacterized protein n=1 Tax=Magallana gigas TaxID=29159 RepID=K1QJK0_MAGGI
MSVLKDKLKQERLACRQMKNEIDQIQLQKLDITRHYEHERDQVSRFKSERELLRSEVKSLKDVMNKKEGGSDTEEVTERRSQRQLERERDDQKMKMSATGEGMKLAGFSALTFVAADDGTDSS